MFRNINPVVLDRSALTNEDISDFLSIALSGNPNLGIDLDGRKFNEDRYMCLEDQAAAILLSGGTILIYDVNSLEYRNAGETDEDMTAQMDWVDAANGTKLMSEGDQCWCAYVVGMEDIMRAFSDPRALTSASNFICDSADLEDGDFLLQLAAFGDYIFC